MVAPLLALPPEQLLDLQNEKIKALLLYSHAALFIWFSMHFDQFGHSNQSSALQSMPGHLHE